MGRALARTWGLAAGNKAQCCSQPSCTGSPRAADPSAAGVSLGPGDCDCIRTLSTWIKKVESGTLGHKAQPAHLCKGDAGPDEADAHEALRAPPLSCQPEAAQPEQEPAHPAHAPPSTHLPACMLSELTLQQISSGIRSGQLKNTNNAVNPCTPPSMHVESSFPDNMQLCLLGAERPSAVQ